MLVAIIQFGVLFAIAVFFGMVTVYSLYCALILESREILIITVIAALLCCAFGWAAWSNVPYPFHTASWVPVTG